MHVLVPCEIKEWLARSTGGMLQSSLKTMEKATFSVTSDNLGEGTLKLSLLLLVFRSTCRQASCRSWSCWRCPSWSLFAPRWCRGSRTCPLLERRNHFKVALKVVVALEHSRVLAIFCSMVFTSDHQCIESKQCTLNTWVVWNENCATRNREC